MNEEVKKLVYDAKNICVIPSQTNEPESLTSALALFYTLKELNKNVNLIIEDFPEKFDFLVPLLDFIASPKNFVISIPRSLADVSQVYYEKNEDSLKIHLTVEKGRVKKENISFYFSEAKPDLVITLGIKDLQNQLINKLDSFGFILDSPILNIDNSLENKKFGKFNFIENKSLSEITLDFIKSFNENLVKKDSANCLLTGLIIYYENFKNPKTTHEIFQICADLIKRGASHKYIVDSLYKMTRKEMHFFSNIFQNLRAADNYEGSFAILNSNEFQNFGENEANFAVEKIKTIGIQSDVLVLWKSHSSEPAIKGFFYSKRPNLINKIVPILSRIRDNIGTQNEQQNLTKSDWVFLSMPGLDIDLVKDKIMNIIAHGS